MTANNATADWEPAAAALLDELIAVGKDAVDRGLVLASAGNMSVWIGADRFAVTASGTWFDRLTRSDFAVLNLAGEQLSGPAPSSEWKLHQRAYQAREDINCVLHLHPHTATLLASLGRRIRLITLDHAFYVGSVGVSPFYPNGSDELAAAAAAQLAEHNCVIMQHHGCSVVADTAQMAFRRAMNLEDAAKMTLSALTIGDETTEFPAGAAFHA